MHEIEFLFVREALADEFINIVSVLLRQSNIYIDHGCKVAKDLYYHYFVNFNLDFLQDKHKIFSW